MTSPVARVGDAADAVVAAGRHAPARIRRVWVLRLHRRHGFGAGAVVLLLYLVAIGDIGFGGTRGDAPGVVVASDWVGKLTATRAPYLFEPVAVLRPVSWSVVFVSPGNVLLGGLLAALVAVNVAASSYQVFTARSCRATTFGRLVAVLPAFGVGFACCAPTLLLAAGTSVAAALAPVFLPLRSWLFPVSLLLMLTMLLWTTTRLPAENGAQDQRPAHQLDDG